ncbi:hypothetical protein C942_04048 [Photobacterium marinum]|uniref:Uncharacterized protein n=1 Tax=Photobacterium marinum TaxID=1056511 RepID=L8J6T0_9GAMM|nr:hypothetical protein C942_04048 [Photobacterium marinum]
MNHSAGTNSCDGIVTVIGGIVPREEVFNTSPKWFTHKPNSYSEVK